MLLRGFVLLCWLTQLVTSQCPLSGQIPDVQAGFNYVVDYLTIDSEGDTLIFSYPLDVCTATSIVNPNYFQYTCSDSNGVTQLTKTQYTDSNCLTSIKVADVWIQGANAEGDIGYFECGGQDGYLELVVSDSGDCTTGNTQTVLVGLGSCAAGLVYARQFTCTSTQAEVLVYMELLSSSSKSSKSSSPSVTGGPYSSSSAPVADTNCDAGLFCNKWSLNSTCLAFPEQLGLYAKMNSCVVSTTTTSVKKPKGSSSLFALNCFLLALVGTWFLF